MTAKLDFVVFFLTSTFSRLERLMYELIIGIAPEKLKAIPKLSGRLYS